MDATNATRATSGPRAPSHRARRPPWGLRRARSKMLGLFLLGVLCACTGVLGLDGLELVPPRPGKPGLDLTAGGVVSTSPKYRLVGALGESPGGDVVGRSGSYTLYGGVVAAGR